MIIELKALGMICEKQIPIEVYYHGEKVGHYFADIMVNDRIIIELKSAACICDEHEAQLVNYLKATKIEIGLLLNFGKKPEIKRKIFSNGRK
jgi:GxxExxY protein